MKGHVPTPPEVVDLMVEKLFRERSLEPPTVVLDPGCGTGPFIEGVLRRFARLHESPPRIVGVDTDGRLIREARKAIDDPCVEIRTEDFLLRTSDRFDLVVGNPPYVGITGLDQLEKAAYRDRFQTAAGRFDLYLLFWEKALSLLKPGGKLVFVTPEKYQYVATAAPLRRLLGACHIDELHFLPEGTFQGLTTYPVITTVSKTRSDDPTMVIDRDLSRHTVELPKDGCSWAPYVRRASVVDHRGPTLGDLCIRVSCGVATGADDVFVVPGESIRPSLRRFAHPTISGRQLSTSNGRFDMPETLLAPYDGRGRLLPESRLDGLGRYLREPSRRRRLMARTCVTAGRKPWYAFHDNFPLKDIMAPKILCKDIAQEPRFWADPEGAIVPRHSVYYMVPRQPGNVDALCDYLNSQRARTWIRGHVQHAANGFLRLQSAVLREMPVPSDVVQSHTRRRAVQATLA